jgi:hypothetical protein
MHVMHDGFPVPGRRRLAIRESALNSRRVLGLSSGRIDMGRLLDRLSVEYGIDYDAVDAHSGVLPQGVEACWLPEACTLFIEKSVHAQMSAGGQRALFPLGHELGHIVLAHRRTANRMKLPQIPAYCNSEWQANCFSAEFTMPIDEIVRLGLTTAELVAGHFGVSRAAATIRIEDLATRGEIKKKPLSVGAHRSF